MRVPSLSLVFPCFNEEENVPHLARRALETLDRHAESGEAIIVNDGSTDGTAGAVRAAAAADARVKLLDLPHGGYGSAVAAGLTAAEKDLVFFSDGDLQFDLAEIELLLPKIADHDIVIGFRQKRADGARRSLLQRCYRVWSRTLLGVPSSVADLNCAFKLFRRETLRSLLPLVSRSALINAELMTKASIAGARITQTAVSHFPRERGQQTGGNPLVVGKAAVETVRLALELRRLRRRAS